MTCPIKTCGCGRSFALAEWQALRFIGVIQPGDNEWAELRLCSGCGSSIAVRVRPVQVLALVPVGEGVAP